MDSYGRGLRMDRKNPSCHAPLHVHFAVAARPGPRGPSRVHAISSRLQSSSGIFIDTCEGESQFRFLYELDKPITEKIETISKEIYGADGIELSELAQKQIETYTRQGYGSLPICMAKTQYSFSHDPKLKGVPSGFTIPIREVRLSAGAGFLYPLLGDMQTMPGLGTRPGFWEVGLDPESGRVVGLF